MRTELGPLNWEYYLSKPGESVCYFSRDFIVNCCETIPELRDDVDKRRFAFVHKYLKGEIELAAGMFGVPLTKYLSREARIVNLSVPQGPLFEAISEEFGKDEAAGTWHRLILSSSVEYTHKVASALLADRRSIIRALLAI